MGRIVVRPAGYTGFLQQLTWVQGNNIPVTAHLWGGAGGGGGNDSSPGGSGSGGGYSQVQFTINEGDVLEVAVGGPGTGGQGGASAGGGGPGSSYLDDASLLFSTLETASPPVFRQFNSSYCTFLNTYGVWTNPTSATTFDRTYTINFPVETWYQFTASADNTADIYLAQTVNGTFTNQLAITSLSPAGTFSNGFFLTAGVKQVRIVGTNYGGPGAVALTIGGAANLAGAWGGASGGQGSSGAGGGGGGSTVMLLTGTILGAGGGGGGGGGGGNVGAAGGQSAPGDRGQAAIGTNEGQNGTNKYVGYDGGGGGGGGGGWGGGNGGLVRDGDQGGTAGAYGGSSGNAANPSGRTPGGAGNEYYRSGVAVGGAAGGNSGGVGYAVFEFDVPGTIVNTAAGGWDPAIETYIKVNGTWIRATTPYIKQGGIWYPVNGYAPIFQNVPGRFGASPRAGVFDPPPAPPVPIQTFSGDRGGYEPTTPSICPSGFGETVGNNTCNAPGPAGGDGPDTCFDPESLVTMFNGTFKKIKDIVVGELVMSQYGESNRVLGMETPPLGNRLMYQFNNHWAFVSEEHPLLSTTGWAAFDPDSWAVEQPFVGNLNKIEIGTTLVTQTGFETVNSIGTKTLPADYLIYNLVLDGDHTYIVENIVVHNKI